MSNIEDLKRKQKELEYNKLQLEVQLENVTAEIERLKNKRYHLNIVGGVSEIPTFYSESSILAMAKYGNVFFSIEEAEKESEKRRLMYEIEEFRKERNGYWKADFEDSNPKHCIVLNNNRLTTLATFKISYFAEFGYFERLSDCERAIEIFGDRILELYAD